MGITRAIELNTVSFHSSSSREDVSYNANLVKSQVDSFFPVLGEISRPKIREFEVRNLERCVLNQSATLSSDPFNLLVDRFHRVAFRGEGLGNVLAPVSSRASIDHAEWVNALREYVQHNFVRERAVVVGVGLSLDRLSGLVQTSLSALPSGSDQISKATK